MFDTQRIIDADWTKDGWEIMIRFTAEDAETAWSGVSDTELPNILGSFIAQSLIAERTQHDKSSPYPE